MKILKHLAIAIIIAFLVTSCGPGRYMTSDINRFDISKVTIIEPATSISLIEKGKGNRMQYNDSLTFVSSWNVLRGTEEFLQAYFLVDLLYLDQSTRELVFHQINQMVGFCSTSKTVDEVPFPPAIDSLMWANDIDYAVCIMHSGFTREKGNYGGQIAKGIALDLVLGIDAYPVKSISDISICILDRKNHILAFYNKSLESGVEPWYKVSTDQQIRKIFEKYFR